jgi:hypothetical protein
LGAPGTIRWSAVDADGEPVELEAAPTIAAVDHDGTETIESTAMVAAGDAAEGRWEHGIAAADIAALGEWTATITADGVAHILIVDVAPARLLTMRELIDYEPSITASEAAQRRELLAAELDCEHICGRAFVPRWRRDVLDGAGVDVIELERGDVHAIHSLTVDGTAWPVTSSDIVVEGDVIRHRQRVFPTGVGNIVVTYTAGWDAPPPTLKRAIARAVRSGLYQGRTVVPDGASSYTADGTTYTIRDVAPLETGIGWVDSIYARYSARKTTGDGSDSGDSGAFSAAWARIDVDPGGRLFSARR